MPVLAASVLLVACGDPRLGPAEVDDTYYEELEAYFDNRVERLKEPQGWLRLAGMLWLEEGENTFGSDAGNDVVFPEGTIAARAGTFTLDGGTVTMRLNRGVRASVDGETVREKVLYGDLEEIPTVNAGPLYFRVIQRDDLYAIRLYNTDNPEADAFTGFPRYDVDTRFFVHARLDRFDDVRTFKTVNVLGQEVELEAMGRLHFKIDGQEHTLIPVGTGDRLWLIIGDQTNRTETYQAGRYLYIDAPAEGSDYTVIDFNRVYNPPCAFNEYTTCSFPPPENQLTVALTVGEKRP